MSNYKIEMLSETEVEAALSEIPTTVKDTDDGQTLYLIEGSYMHMLSLLLMLREK